MSEWTIKVNSPNGLLEFSESDIVNPDGYEPVMGPYSWVPFLIHDHGTTIGVVFAKDETHAFHILADEKKLVPWYVSNREMCDNPIALLGTDPTPYDIYQLDVIQLPYPKFSLTALWYTRKETD